MAIAPDRRALVTGGASGFGHAIARSLRADGVAVALLDLPGERLDRAATELGAIPAPADIRDAGAVRAATAAAVEALGGLDTLVHCAGVIHLKPLADVSVEDWDRTLEVNLRGAFLVSQACAPHLVASRRGRIIAISSDAGRRGFALIAAYSASKFGLIGLMESLAGELAPHVTVNSVCPTGVPTTAMGQQVLDWKTGAMHQPPEAIMAATATQNLVGRNATTEDVTAAVRFLLSDEASFLTGVSLDVDGGWRLGAIPGVEPR